MQRKSRIAVLATVVVSGVAAAALAATWWSSDRWATWSNGGYTLRNDVWGSGAGPQTIWANSYQSWGVWADHPNTSGVKAYPHVARGIWKNTNSINWAGSYFNVSRPSSGSYCSAYDIWLNGSTYEIMLWMNRQGAVGPIGSQQASNQSVGGHTWNVYRGSNGSNEVFSFVRTSNTNSGNVDLKAIFTWLQNRGWFNNPQLGEIQFGFEITSSSGGMNFIVNGYAVWEG